MAETHIGIHLGVPVINVIIGKCWRLLQNVYSGGRCAINGMLPSCEATSNRQTEDGL